MWGIIGESAALANAPALSASMSIAFMPMPEEVQKMVTEEEKAKAAR
jgi:hypothetical protein